MTSPIETYRVSAYNTSKLSENKIHDDSVARKFGFSGGLVPGVDVFAYMIHVPVKKWGRAFLERGVIETRFVKPVYDGEFADVTATESGGVLTIEVESRGEPCATGTASFRSRTIVRPQRSPSGGRSMRPRMRSENGSVRRRVPGPAMRPPNIWRISASRTRSTRAKVSVIPACCSEP